MPRRLFRFISDCFFPPCCPVCRIPENLLVCKTCRKKLEKLYSPWPIVRDPMEFDSGYSAFFFSDPALISLVYCLKNQGTDHAVSVAAMALYKIIQSNVTLSGVDAITWIPRSGKNIIEYGFDQSELLAKALSKLCGIPCKKLLYRKRDNKVQHRLITSKRMENMKGCFECRQKVFGGDVILIDDVITSGSTVNEGAKTLKKSGYDFVRVLSLASTDRRITKSEI